MEIAAAFASKLRGKFITGDEYQLVRTQLASDSRKRYHLLPVDSERVDEAINLTTRHKLRGYDVIHLAAALHLNRALLSGGLTPLNLITADIELLLAAQAEGLATENPNAHP